MQHYATKQKHFQHPVSKTDNCFPNAVMKLYNSLDGEIRGLQASQSMNDLSEFEGKASVLLRTGALAMDEEMVMVLWLQVLCVTGAAVPDTCVVVPSCPTCRSSACLRHLPFQGSRTTLEVCMASTSLACLAARLIFVIVAKKEVDFYKCSKQFLVPICNKIHV